MYDHEKRDALRLLQGLENGTMSGADAFAITETTDPVIIFFVFRFLREKYPPGSADSSGVMGRLLELSSTYPEVVRKAKEGEQDVICEWFNETYDLREFFVEEENLFDLLVEKLNG